MRPHSGRPGFAAPAGADAVRLQHIAQVSGELGAADTMDAVVEAAVNHAADAIGASVSTLMLTEGDELVLVAGRGLQSGVTTAFGRFSLADHNPASEAARSGRAVILSRARVVSDYPVLRDWMPPDRSLVCLPLGRGQPAAGVIGLTFDADWLPGPAEIDFLTAYADACGQAVRRVRAYEAARRHEQRLTFLAEASAELSGSLDYRATLAAVAQLAVPRLADWAAVHIVVDGEPSTVAVAHADPDKVRWAWDLQERYPPRATAPAGAARVIRTGDSEFYPEITEAMLAATARDADHLQLARDLELSSGLVVPLLAHGRTLGAMTLLRAGARVPYDRADLTLAEDIGRRAGVAIDNACLHQQAQDVALQLQRAVLPEALDRIPHWEIAGHYAPGGRDGVGGDFYDGVELPDGRLAFVIGDVMGHGLRAAAAMAQLRAAVRAFLSVDPEPTVVVSKLDMMYERLRITQLASLLYAVADPAHGGIRFVNAGHYPPLLVRAGKPAHFLAAPPGLLLGAGGDNRKAADADFGGTDIMLLYTDGLVEVRDEAVDVGLSRLAAGAPTLLRGPLADGLAALVGALNRADADDDVTALALRCS